MSYTLLETVQTILSSLDSDEVTDINETTEAYQVARVVKQAWENITARADLPEHKQLFALDGPADTDTPVLLTKPSNVKRIEWIKYNVITSSETEPNFDYVTILPLEQFLSLTDEFGTDDSNVSSMTISSIDYYFKTDKRPQFCAIVDDSNIVFDSYDSAVDTNLYLESSKTKCFGLVLPTFSLSNTYNIDIDDQQYPLLLNEAKSLAFLELKQVANEAAVQETKRQWTTLQRTKELSKLSALDQFANFGRK